MATPLSLAKLNPRQREAVLHGDGPLLVLAGAGSGKTSTMTYRIAHLVAERRVPPTAILGLSFTNKAAGELRERVGSLVKSTGRSAKGIVVSTFHSLCVRLLRRHADRLGGGYTRDFTILDPTDQREILRDVLKQVKIDDRKFDLDTLLFAISGAKSDFLTIDQATERFLASKKWAEEYGIAAAHAYPRYLSQARALNAMDFDDLLFQATALLESDRAVRAECNDRFRHILVDEYQDTNAAQFRLLELLTEHQQNLCVVGDDDQSIYAWRGADPSHILGFGRRYKDARVVTLDQNYRSVTTVLDAANAVIGRNVGRHPKTLWSDRGTGEPIDEIILEDDREEAEWVAEEIDRLTKAGEGGAARRFRDVAVLYRSNAQSRAFEEALRAHRIPYAIVGGMSFLERKEVKDVLSYLRLMANPRDDASLRRILNWPARGLGRTSLEALAEAAFKREIPMAEALREADAIAPRAAAGARALLALLETWRERLRLTPAEGPAMADWARGFLVAIGAKKGVEDDCEDPAAAARRWENVEEVVHALGRAPHDLTEAAPATAEAWLSEFLQRMQLDAQAEDRDEKEEGDKNEVTLLTLHGSKGLEYPVVFLVGCEEGFLPHRRTIAEAADFSEERRLCYVGITRARDRLFLTRAKQRIRFGKPVPRVVSRFLAEIPPQLLSRRDFSHSPEPTTAQAKQEHEVKVKSFFADFKSRLGTPRALLAALLLGATLLAPAPAEARSRQAKARAKAKAAIEQSEDPTTPEGAAALPPVVEGAAPLEVRGAIPSGGVPQEVPEGGGKDPTLDPGEFVFISRPEVGPRIEGLSWTSDRLKVERSPEGRRMVHLVGRYRSPEGGWILHVVRGESRLRLARQDFIDLKLELGGRTVNLGFVATGPDGQLQSETMVLSQGEPHPAVDETGRKLTKENLLLASLGHWAFFYSEDGEANIIRQGLIGLQAYYQRFLVPHGINVELSGGLGLLAFSTGEGRAKLNTRWGLARLGMPIAAAAPAWQVNLSGGVLYTFMSVSDTTVAGVEGYDRGFGGNFALTGRKPLANGDRVALGLELSPFSVTDAYKLREVSLEVGYWVLLEQRRFMPLTFRLTDTRRENFAKVIGIARNLIFSIGFEL